MNNKFMKAVKALPPRVPNNAVDNAKYWFSAIETDTTEWRVHGMMQAPDREVSGSIMFNDGVFTNSDYSKSYSDSEYGSLFWDWKNNEPEHRMLFRKIYLHKKVPMTVKEYWNVIDSFAHCEPVPVPSYIGDYPTPPNYHAKEEYPMRAYDAITTSANHITIAPAASASVDSKTDLQTQREYLLGRHREIDRSFDYGTIRNKMSDAFNLHVDNTPKTAAELIAGITSGKYTLDTKKAALQNIAIANDRSFEDEETDSWISAGGDPFFAMNWGGLTPDRTGFENARTAFTTSLKAAKDTIMIGTPEAGLAALQALENWTPPAAAS